jgi:hypothetical protein
MKQYFFILPALFLCLGMTGCQATDEKTNEETTSVFTKLDSAPFSQSVFPEWLTIKINEIEASADALTRIRVYKGEWNKEPVYLIWDNFSSCLLCEVYNETGRKVTFTEESVTDFDTTSTNWVLIYEYSNFNL